MKKDVFVINYAKPFAVFFGVCGLIFATGLIGANIIVGPNWVRDTVFIILFVIPFLCLSLIYGMFKIRVNKNVITIRKNMGLVQYTISVSNIESVKVITTANRYGAMRKFKFLTTNHKRFTVESQMKNGDLMEKYIEDYLDPSKVEWVYKIAPGVPTIRDEELGTLVYESDLWYLLNNPPIDLCYNNFNIAVWFIGGKDLTSVSSVQKEAYRSFFNKLSTKRTEIEQVLALSYDIKKVEPASVTIGQDGSCAMFFSTVEGEDFAVNILPNVFVENSEYCFAKMNGLKKDQ